MMRENRFINHHSEVVSESFFSVQEILKQVQDDKHYFPMSFPRRCESRKKRIGCRVTNKFISKTTFGRPLCHSGSSKILLPQKDSRQAGMTIMRHYLWTQSVAVSEEGEL